MSYLSFENNIIEASGNLILKSNGDTIDCCGCNLINVSNITSSGRKLRYCIIGIGLPVI